MTATIDPTRSSGAVPLPRQEEAIQPRQGEKNQTAIEDQLSLGEHESVNETYGPGLNVATPYELLRNLVTKTLQEQGLELQFSTASGEVDFTTLTQEEAQELVADDGYFGVEKTSQRIVDFAISGFGGDPEKLQQMKSAIDQGFSEAQEAFGGALPEISQQTYETIMEKLDAFAAQFEPSGE
ncbi:hypothetical protein SAMN05660420_00149 [Desulfuromusa kysingii]|uniref:DUF5610 domain-containing protein n=1 Tax=Desulfuromusa kysingii TaxID=37625 RepID=A0A1H3VM07_9BACT|nr:hypothetical protein [Desulfuromusa kysingii]SDZ75731.1 hypothetical protein SAMN05660420_00149 [Desulfuromusa kysingii]